MVVLCVTYLAAGRGLSSRTLGLLELAFQSTGTCSLRNRLTAAPATLLARGGLAGGTFGLFGAADVDADICLVGGDAGVLDWLAAAPAVLKRMLIQLFAWV